MSSDNPQSGSGGQTTALTKAESNRRNARHSTGPKSVNGKATVARNALRHGLLSWQPVLPNVENPADWERHLKQTLEDLAPATYMETVLAERVALLFWRLARVARFEREAAAVAQETAGDVVEQNRQMRRYGVSSLLKDQSDHPEDSADDEQEAVKARALYLRFSRMTDDSSLSGSDAMAVLEEIAAAANVDLWDDDFPFPPPSFPEDFSYDDWNGWTAGGVRAVIADIAKYTNKIVEEVLSKTAGKLAGREGIAELQNQQIQAELDRYRRTHILPSREDMERISRYETSLERQMYRALHELQRMQASRLGQIVTAPIVVDVNLSGSSVQ